MNHSKCWSSVAWSLWWSQLPEGRFLLARRNIHNAKTVGPQIFPSASPWEFASALFTQELSNEHNVLWFWQTVQVWYLVRISSSNQKFYTDPLWKVGRSCNSVGGCSLKSTHRVAVMAQLSIDFFFFSSGVEFVHLVCNPAYAWMKASKCDYLGWMSK